MVAAIASAPGEVIGGTEDDLGLLLVGDEGKEGIDEGGGFGGGLVHLPVGGDQWFAHVNQSSLRVW